MKKDNDIDKKEEKLFYRNNDQENTDRISDFKKDIKAVKDIYSNDKCSWYFGRQKIQFNSFLRNFIVLSSLLL